MADTDIFPELMMDEEAFPSPENGPVYVPSSQSVGCGHEDNMNRMSPITNGEFPNTESGEGKG